MLAPVGLSSDWATPQLLPRRVRKSRSAHDRRETGNTAAPAPPLAAIQAASFPARVVRVVVARLPFPKPSQWRPEIPLPLCGIGISAAGSRFAHARLTPQVVVDRLPFFKT